MGLMSPELSPATTRKAMNPDSGNRSRGSDSHDEDHGFDGYLQNYCIYEALDDAMTLGVDSVNLSLGYVSGFAEDADPMFPFLPHLRR